MSLPALILAAGASSRMGRPKALVLLDGVTFLAGLVGRLRVAGCAPIVVVAGAHFVEIQAELPDGVVLVHAPDWAEGMRASLRAGLRACPPGDLLLTHVDRPRVAPATLAALLAAPPGQAGVPTYAGQDGHPVRLSAQLRPRLLALDDTPLCDLLIHAARLPVGDPDVLLNINSPADLAALIPQTARKS